MTERPGDATEGVAKSVICSVSYKCKKNKPTIVWNYEDMQSSLKTKENSSNTFITVSNLTFIGSLEDDGKSLTCTAQFVTGETSDSETLHIKSEFLHVIHSGQDIGSYSYYISLSYGSGINILLYLSRESLKEEFSPKCQTFGLMMS